MILDELALLSKKRIDAQKEIISMAAVMEETERLMENERRNKELGPVFEFEKALSKKGLSVISEVKKASPSKGVIAEDFPYLDIALEYERSGADAVSCLTEPDRFKGSDEYLKDIAARVDIPVLRKDFTIDPYMIYQAKLMGAQAVLLIAAILSNDQLSEYFALADRLGLSCLFEAHDGEEVRRCLACGARILGVNNRNLKDFSVDINNSVRLRELVPSGVIFVSESGIEKPEDVKILKDNGTDAVLVGEMLMRSPDKGELIRRIKEL